MNRSRTWPGTRLILVLVLVWTAFSWRWMHARLARMDRAGEDLSFAGMPTDGDEGESVGFQDFPGGAGRADEGRMHVFELPLAAGAAADADAMDIRMSAPAGTDLWVQALVECDHRYRFAHDRRIRVPSSGRAEFRIPFGGEADTWRSIGHEGRWSRLEMPMLRSVQFKVFSRVPLPVPPEARFRMHRSREESPVTLAWMDAVHHRFARGDRLELMFDLSRVPGNLFAPDTFGLACVITDPEGGTAEILPFLYQAFDAATRPVAEEIRPLGAKHWRVRYRPSLEGTHAYALHIGTGEERRILARGTFEVTAGDAPAFIRISPDNPRYFVGANGSFFYPVGWNLVYPVDVPYDIRYVDYLPMENSLATMLKLIDDLADSGGNLFRFWMTDWFAGIEWNREVDHYGGIGVYNLKNAWLIDRILEHSRTRGVYLLFETLNHVRLNASHSGGQHPYLASNGGFMPRLQNFWTDPRAEEADTRRLRYIVSRFADSPAIHSWNHMSEPDLVSRGVWPQARTLMFRQLERMREWDPYGRPLSNHINTHNRDFSFYEDPAIEFVHSNAYPGIHRLHEDQVFAVRRFSDVFADHAMPVLISEYGGHWAADPAEKMRRDIVAGLWAGVCSDLSGTPLNWWWNFTYGEELGREYRVVADFLQGEDLIAEDTEERGFWRNRSASTSSRDRNLRALMVGNRFRRWVYLFNMDTVCRSRMFPTECSENRVVFSEMEDGDYEVEYWLPGEGLLPHTDRLRVARGRGTLRPPALTHALVARIVRAPPEVPEAETAGDLPAEATARMEDAGKRAAEVPERDWAEPGWRIVPMLSVRAPAAAVRSFHQVRIALPVDRRGAFPEVRGPDGVPVAYTWAFDGEETGWILTIPGKANGPFDVRPVTAPEVPPGPFDEEAVGLLLSVTEGQERVLTHPRIFERTFAARTNTRSLRMAQIDLLENPLGANDHFLTRFEGPLLVPSTGIYRFSLNSDDGSFLKINGQIAVQWLGNHTPEGGNKPLYNEWRRQHALRLERGVHHLEYFHQESTGWQMARVGWMPEGMADADADLHAFFSAAAQPADPAWQTLPPEFLHGYIPCAVEFLDGGRLMGTQLPAAGLRLRRPGRTIYAVRWRDVDGGDAVTQWHETEGRRVIETRAGGLPVHVFNHHLQPFSMDWEQGRSEQGARFIKVLLYDVALPVTFASAGIESVRVLQPRTWELFDLPAEAGADSFSLALGAVPLVRAPVKPSPPEPVLPDRLPTVRQVDRLLVLTPAGESLRLPDGSDPRGGSRGTRGAGMETAYLAADIWQEEPAGFLATMGGRPEAGTGVALVLDRRPALLNLDRTAFERAVMDWITALEDAGYTPVLVLGPGLDASDPVHADHALFFVELRDRWNLPYIDARIPRETEP